MDLRAGSIVALGLLAVGCGSSDASPDPPGPTAPSFEYPLDDQLRLHHIQALSTHNSYHVESEGNVLVDWMYSHEPLAQQLDSLGVRHFELDLRYDWAGERFEVYHLPVIDEATTCRAFTACLGEVASWSKAHPGHHPVVIQLEIKDGLPADPEDYWTRLHGEIDAVFARDELLLPGDVGQPLGAALADQGWPTLGELRGRVLFTMDNGGDLVDSYTHGGVGLDGRLIFPSSSPGDPYAGIAVVNDPTDSVAIADALAANMLVRTRADAGVVGAQANETERRELALSGGAHFVTTDFPAPVDGMEYSVSIVGGTPSRCNPVTAPAECTSEAIEEPNQLD
jgi:Phosphoinositide phospholipase C, Ca2+-dependent